MNRNRFIDPRRLVQSAEVHLVKVLRSASWTAGTPKIAQQVHWILLVQQR